MKRKYQKLRNLNQRNDLSIFGLWRTDTIASADSAGTKTIVRPDSRAPQNQTIEMNGPLGQWQRTTMRNGLVMLRDGLGCKQNPEHTKRNAEQKIAQKTRWSPDIETLQETEAPDPWLVCPHTGPSYWCEKI